MADSSTAFTVAAGELDEDALEHSSAAPSVAAAMLDEEAIEPVELVLAIEVVTVNMVVVEWYNVVVGAGVEVDSGSRVTVM